MRSTLLIIPFFFASMVLSQEPIPERLSLKDAVRLAMNYNSELKSARWEVDRANARIVEAWGNALPSFDFSGGYTRALKLPVFYANFDGDPIAIEMGLNHSLNMSLTGRQTSTRSRRRTPPQPPLTRRRKSCPTMSAP